MGQRQTPMAACMKMSEWVDGHQEVTELSPAPKERLEALSFKLIPLGAVYTLQLWPGAIKKILYL